MSVFIPYAIALPIRKPSGAIDFFTKIVVNPLFWATYSSIAAGWLFIAALFGAVPLFVGFAAIAGSIGYIRSHRDEIFYELSLLIVVLRNLFAPRAYPWSSQIDENLYLGGMPLSEVSVNDVSAILSVVEAFELEDRWLFTKPVSHEAWRRKGFETMRVNAIDLEGVKLEEVKQGVEFIRQMATQGKSVYVHCKAGVGRSATVVACYLLKYGCKNGRIFHSVEEVIEYVLEKRGSVLLQNPGPKATLQAFCSAMSEATRPLQPV